MKEYKGKINESHGIYLHLEIDEDVKKMIDDMKKKPAVKHYEVTVKVNGRVKHFTLNTFIKKLGFKNVG